MKITHLWLKQLTKLRELAKFLLNKFLHEDFEAATIQLVMLMIEGLLTVVSMLHNQC